MVVAEISSVQYLSLVKDLLYQAGYKYVILAVGRRADCPEFYRELEQDWTSINDVTDKRIAFLHFTFDPEDEQEVEMSQVAHVVASRGFAKNRNIGYEEIWDKMNPELSYKNSEFFQSRYTAKREQIQLKYLKKLTLSIKDTLAESATQLLRNLNKSESEIPFLHIYQKPSAEFSINIHTLYRKYGSLYQFVRKLIMAIEKDETARNQIAKLYAEIDAAKQQLIYKESNINNLGETIKRRRLEFEDTLKNFNNIKVLLSDSNWDFTDRQRYYLEAIAKREKYVIQDSLKALFVEKYLDHTHINKVIAKHANQDLHDLDQKFTAEINRLSDILNDKINAHPHITEVINKSISSAFEEVNRLEHHEINNSNTFLSDVQEPIQKSESRVFKIALTFAGEDRYYVSQVASELSITLGRDAVFYDNYFPADLARLNLDIYLQNIYHQRADYIVVFLSENYDKKEWCGIEWRAIRDLIKQEQRRDRIILVKLGNFTTPGVFSTDGYLDGIKFTPTEVAKYLLSRVDSK